MSLIISFIKYVFLLIVVLNNIAIGKTLDYDITIKNTYCLTIKVNFIGAQSGVTKLDVPKKSCYQNQAGQIKNIKLTNPNQKLKLSNGIYSIDHKPYDTITINYDFCSSPYQSYFYSSQNTCYFINNETLIMPKGIDFNEVNYKTHFTSKQFTQKAKITKPQDALDSFSYFGKKDHINLGPFNTLGNSLYIQDGVLIDKHLVSCSIKKLLYTQQALFKDAIHKPISIYLLNNKGVDEIQGLKLASAILIEVNKNDSTEVIEVIAHELMHRVFGDLIPPTSGNENKWFFEGFTEYYGTVERQKS